MQQEPLRVLIHGGGIGGLTLAACIARNNLYTNKKLCDVTVVERSLDPTSCTLGGGIALWSPSITALEYAGALPAIKKHSEWLPSSSSSSENKNFSSSSSSSFVTSNSISYRSFDNKILATPSKNFTQRFPMLCVKRNDVLKSLVETCKKLNGIDLRLGATVENFERNIDGSGSIVARIKQQQEQVKDENFDLLIGADGINSPTRTKLISESRNDFNFLSNRNNNNITPIKHCNYVYYRTCVDIDEQHTPKEEIQPFFECSFETWHGQIRFGYVPLKKPTVFWFVSVPTDIDTNTNTNNNNNNNDNKKDSATRPITTAEHEKIKHLLKDCCKTSTTTSTTTSSSGVVDIQHLLKITPKENILRTEINKIRTETVPVHSPDGRVILLGDAWHATAPNIAMGAGLAIEDSIELALRINKIAETVPLFVNNNNQKNNNQKNYFLDSEFRRMSKEYRDVRFPRALTVQTMADNIARVGQVPSFFYPSVLGRCRNSLMQFLSSTFPSIETAIFEKAVLFAVGGGRSKISASSSVSNSSIPFLHSLLSIPAGSWYLYNNSTKTPAHLAAASTAGSLHCLPSVPYEKTSVELDERLAMLSRVIGYEEFHNKLPKHIREFRRNPAGGSGVGKAYSFTQQSGFLGKFLLLAGLVPKNMKDVPFSASVSPILGIKEHSASGNPAQQWTRCFGSGSDVSYITSRQFLRISMSHESSPATGIIFEESLPGASFFSSLVRFQIKAKIVSSPSSSSSSSSSENAENNNNDNKEKSTDDDEKLISSTQVHYNSIGCSLLLFGDYFPYFRIPLPKFLSPSSNWKEEPTKTGWKFQGSVNLPPILGGKTLTVYGGDFAISSHPSTTTTTTSQNISASAAAASAATSKNSTTTTTSSSGNLIGKKKSRRIIISGGSGLLGTYVVQSFLIQQQQQENISEIIVLSREANKYDPETFLSTSLSCVAPLDKQFLREKLKFVFWDGKTGNNWKHFINSETVLINLAGQNLGESAWTQDFKQLATKSRLDCIDAMKIAMKEVLEERGESPLAFLSASGTGIFGHRSKSEAANEFSDVSTNFFGNNKNENENENKNDDEGRKFRYQCCKEIEQAAFDAVNEVFGEEEKITTTATATATKENKKSCCHPKIPKVFPLRVGLLLSKSGGILPHYETAARLGVSRLCSGDQYIPWCHVTDAANAIVDIALADFSSPSFCTSHPFCLVSPNPVTNKEFLSAIATSRNYFIPKMLFKKIPFFSGGITVPEFLLKNQFVLGESSCVVADSCYVESVFNSNNNNINNNNENQNNRDNNFFFRFRFAEIDKAVLSWECSVNSKDC